MKDFENVQLWDCDWDYCSCFMVESPTYGNYVTVEDYKAILEAYKEIKWMYEGLCK